MNKIVYFLNFIYMMTATIMFNEAFIMFDAFFPCNRYQNQDILPGDLLFFRAKSILDVFSNFVSAVSKSHAQNFYHVSMVIESTSEKITTIEAAPEKGVEFHEYSNMCDARGVFVDIEISRLEVGKTIVRKAINIATKYIGEAYNDIFSPDFINSKGEHSFYCSQLIQHAFNNAAGIEIFSNIPMQFPNKEYWEAYYAKLGINEIPEGVDGTHPGSIYNADFLIDI